MGVWIACAVIGHLVLERRLPDRDPLLFPLAMFLTGWGLNLIARLVPSFAERQTLWLVIGLAALLTVTALPGDLRWLRRYRYTWLIGGLALLAITILIGENPAAYRAAPVDLVRVGAHLLPAVRTAQNSAGGVPGELFCRSPAFYARGYDPDRIVGSAIAGVSGAACC